MVEVVSEAKAIRDEAFNKTSAYQKGASALRYALIEVLDHFAISTRYAGKYRVLGITIDISPHDGRSGLTVIDQDNDEVESLTVSPIVAWQLITKNEGAVLLGIQNRQMSSLSQDGIKSRPVSMPEDLLDGVKGVLQTTHALIMPLSSNSGNILGIISIEVECPDASDRWDFILMEGVKRVVSFCNRACFALLTFPETSRQTQAEDEYMPVMGAGMIDTFNLLSRFANSSETVLITGPTGVGKTKIARWMHSKSDTGPFIQVSLGSFSDDLRLSQLYGWKKGAYTGADTDYDGLLKQAEGGTLLIDEIDVLRLEDQFGLLQLMENGLYRRVGDPREKTASVRFIITSNTNLGKAVAEGRFREDLYYRISVLGVAIPSLNNRVDEIGLWFDYFARSVIAENNLDVNCIVESEAQQILNQANWRGNLRQLSNIAKRIVIGALPAVGDIFVDARMVVEALSFEHNSETSAVQMLERTAAKMLDELEDGEQIYSSKTQVLFAMLWYVATQRYGNDINKIAALLGKQSAVESRNYHKEKRRELKKLAEFYRVKRVPVPRELDELL